MTRIPVPVLFLFNNDFFLFLLFLENYWYIVGSFVPVP